MQALCQPSRNASRRNFYVFATTLADWQHVVDVIRLTGWPTEYSEDGIAMTMPNFAEAVFSRSLEQAVLWKVSPVRGLSINCHFFTRDEIEFDIAPSEIHGQPELDALAAFITTIGRATTKGVLLCHENAPDCPVGTYSPDSRLFVRTSSDDRASTG